MSATPIFNWLFGQFQRHIELRMIAARPHKNVKVADEKLKVYFVLPKRFYSYSAMPWPPCFSCRITVFEASRYLILLGRKVMYWILALFSGRFWEEEKGSGTHCAGPVNHPKSGWSYSRWIPNTYFPCVNYSILAHFSPANSVMVSEFALCWLLPVLHRVGGDRVERQAARGYPS